MVWRKRSTQDFAEEIKAHLELEADDLKQEGLSEDEARWQARRAFGNVRSLWLALHAPKPGFYCHRNPDAGAGDGREHGCV
jgi:hypothetical protein